MERPSAGAKRRRERVWRDAKREAAESNALDLSAVGMLVESVGGIDCHIERDAENVPLAAVFCEGIGCGD